VPAGVIADYHLLPVASSRTGALAFGAVVGLAVSWLLLKTGLFKRSYESEGDAHDKPVAHEGGKAPGAPAEAPPEQPQFNHRLEAIKEIGFLLPIIVCSAVAYKIAIRPGPVGAWWSGLVQHPVAAGLLGSLFGYFVGCGVVWATRILGTLGFGREAMGLGDVHLMGAAGAVIGPLMVVVAFFVAPFFGLAWALSQMLFKKIRQIPYGPFLSLAVFTVMIFHEWIVGRLTFLFEQ
jgi:leader peptidase (prepilin peptidase)/N-methyltransferase